MIFVSRWLILLELRLHLFHVSRHIRRLTNEAQSYEQQGIQSIEPSTSRINIRIKEERMHLQHRRRSQQAEMLLDQSVMWLRKVTNSWCDPEDEISV